jgi:hypothetical protein
MAKYKVAFPSWERSLDRKKELSMAGTVKNVEFQYINVFWSAMFRHGPFVARGGRRRVEKEERKEEPHPESKGDHLFRKSIDE